MRWNVIWIHFAITVQQQIMHETLFVSRKKDLMNTRWLRLDDIKDLLCVGEDH